MLWNRDKISDGKNETTLKLSDNYLRHNTSTGGTFTGYTHIHLYNYITSDEVQHLRQNNIYCYSITLYTTDKIL